MRRARRGATAVTFALSLTALLGMGAIAVDLGYQRVVGRQLQAGVDAAAMAGAAYIGDGPDAVREAARVIAARNQAGAEAIALDDADIELGDWDETSGTFTVAADEASATAVRVSRRESDVPTFLGRIFGADTLQVTRSAIGMTTAGAVCGVLADTEAIINGNWSTDSYDSRLGTYGGANVGSESGVCSNGDLEAAGHASIYGNLHNGRDPGDTLSVSGSVLVTGETSELPEEIPMPSADSRAARTSNDNSRIPRTSRGRSAVSGTSFSLNSTDTLTLSAGTYYFTAFSINGGAELRTRGEVVIYIAGDAHINGHGIVNQDQAPSNLTIYVDGARGVEVNGTADFYGSIIAPQSDSHLNGNAGFYGMFISDRLELNGNGRMHVDLALVDDQIGRVAPRVVLVQ